MKLGQKVDTHLFMDKITRFIESNPRFDPSLKQRVVNFIDDPDDYGLHDLLCTFEQIHIDKACPTDTLTVLKAKQLNEMELASRTANYSNAHKMQTTASTVRHKVEHKAVEVDLPAVQETTPPIGGRPITLGTIAMRSTINVAGEAGSAPNEAALLTAENFHPVSSLQKTDVVTTRAITSEVCKGFHSGSTRIDETTSVQCWVKRFSMLMANKYAAILSVHMAVTGRIHANLCTTLAKSISQFQLI